MAEATIQIKFFASLREHVGQGEAQLAEAKMQQENIKTVLDVWNVSTSKMAMPENTLMAINMEYVEADHAVKMGDEVAFFPPVTGG
ncbi:MAG: MoaD/ThiS family protein [Woeseiaceae bacterium]